MDKLSIDLPHSLGAAEAKRRIEGNTGALVSRMPPGATANPRWNGNRLDLDISALGQRVDAAIDVQEQVVRVEVALPRALGFLRPLVEAGVRRAGTEMLEDKRPR